MLTVFVIQYLAISIRISFFFVNMKQTMDHAILKAAKAVPARIGMSFAFR